MTDLTCTRQCNCTIVALAASLAVGVIAAVLTFLAIVTAAPVFLWVAFGIAVGYLAVLLVTAAFGSCFTRRCIAIYLPALLTGILGTALTAVVLLAVTFAATSVIGAIITGALLFFFSLTVIVTACLIKCLVTCAD